MRSVPAGTRKAHPGSPGSLLTPRQIQVLRLLATGATNVEVASRMNIGGDTVKFHLKGIFEKLHVKCRTEAVVRALQWGLVTVPGPQTGPGGGSGSRAPMGSAPGKKE